MNTNFEEAREKVANLKRQHEEAQQSLTAAETRCIHKWGEVTPDHIYSPGFTTQGDPPGTMGIDWRGPCYIPPETIYQWKRECNICGKVEYTRRTEDTITKTPKF